MKTKIIANLILTLLCHLILPFQGAAAEVDLMSGGYVHRHEVSLGNITQFRLEFRSRSTWLTNIGYGWCGPWNAQFTALGDQTYRFTSCSTRQTFAPQPSSLGGDVKIVSSQGGEMRRDPLGFWVFHPDGTKWKFDFNGRLSERWSGSKTEKFQYDVLGRLRHWNSPHGLITFRYSGVSLTADTLQLATGEKIRFQHEGEDLVSIITSKQTTYFDYDEIHNLITIRAPERLPTSIEYDPLNDRVKRVIDENKCTKNYEYLFPRLDRQLVYLDESCPDQPIRKSQTDLRFTIVDDQIKSVSVFERSL